MIIRYGPGGFGVGLIGGIIGLILFALLVGSLVWLIVVLARPRRWGRPWVGGPWFGYGQQYGQYGPGGQGNPILAELDMAYARGQLSREEYFRRRADLTGWMPPGGTPGFTGGPGAGPGPGSGSGSGSPSGAAPGSGTDPGSSTGSDPGAPSSS
ncbi:MAG: SHOCT domain-containing protein [Candidatus Dormiibacterota bacterium]